MCEVCREKLREVIQRLAANDEDFELVQKTHEVLGEYLPERIEHVQTFARENGLPEEEIPTAEEIEANLFDSLIASQIAVAAAAMAGKTTGYTEEGGLPQSMVLGIWAGTTMGIEAAKEIAFEENIARHLLGMGDN